MGQFDLCKRHALARGPASCMDTGQMPHQLNMGPRNGNQHGKIIFTLLHLNFFVLSVF